MVGLSSADNIKIVFTLLAKVVMFYIRIFVIEFWKSCLQLVFFIVFSSNYFVLKGTNLCRALLFFIDFFYIYNKHKY